MTLQKEWDGVEVLRTLQREFRRNMRFVIARERMGGGAVGSAAA
jgi:hypothetical protein